MKQKKTTLILLTKIQLTLLIIAVVIFSVLATKLYLFQNKLIPQKDPAEKAGLSVANYNFIAFDKEQEKKAPYLTFQIKHPSTYYHSTPQTYINYRSMGGGGYAAMILTKGFQFPADADTEEDAYKKLNDEKTDCILIYPDDVTAIPGINNDEQSINGITVSKSELKNIGKYQVHMREASKGVIPIYDAFFEVGNQVIYHLQTCNRNNRKDLEVVIANLQIRGEYGKDWQ